MRGIVLCLALLAALKIWVQDSVYRSATQAALVAAYRVRAEAACGSSAIQAGTASPAGVAAPDWAAAEEPRVVIGKASVPVHIWDYDHELWAARFRNAYLVLDSGGATCSYDLLGDSAEVARP